MVEPADENVADDVGRSMSSPPIASTQVIASAVTCNPASEKSVGTTTRRTHSPYIKKATESFD